MRPRAEAPNVPVKASPRLSQFLHLRHAAWTGLAVVVQVGAPVVEIDRESVRAGFVVRDA